MSMVGPDKWGEIVWLEDVSKQPYVRAIMVESRTRRGRLGYGGNGRAVGYENLPTDTPLTGGPYFRRVFYLTPWDPVWATRSPHGGS